MAEEDSKLALVYAGTGIIMAGGFMEAMEAIATITFGLVPTALIGIGGVLMVAGFYEKFVGRK